MNPNRPPSTVRLVRESRQRTKVTAVGVTATALVTFLSAMVLLPEAGSPADEPPGAPTPTGPSPPGGLRLREEFLAASLEARWTPFACGAPTAVTLAPGAPGLSLAVDTRRAAGHPRHGVGVVSAPLEVGVALRVRALLDWRPPANACYREAGLLVVPEGKVPTGPFDPTSLWPAACLEVVGVPPGERARRLATVRTGPHPRAVFTDGWPASRAGRVVGRTALEVVVDERGASFSADGQTLGRGAVTLGPRVRLLLFTTSNENYPPRPVVFEEVLIEGQPAAVAAGPTPRSP